LISPRDALDFSVKNHIGSHAAADMIYTAPVRDVVTVVGNMSFGNHQHRDHVIFFTLKGSLSRHSGFSFGSLSGTIHGGLGVYKNAQGIITSAEGGEHGRFHSLISGHIWGDNVPKFEARKAARLAAEKKTSESPGMEFFIGFVTGVEAQIGNPAVCAKDAELTLTAFETGFALIKKGISDFSISDIEQGLQDWAQGVNLMSLALRDCGINKLADGIEKIVTEISSGLGGILRFLAEEILNVVDHPVYTLFREAMSSYEQGKYADSGNYTGQIVGILLNGK